jgi:hypothetical protein
MKRIILFLLVVTFISCKGKHKTTQTSSDKEPAFITAKIEEYKKLNDPKKSPVITRYTYNEKIVYYFRMPCCDQMNVLYDSEGKELCKPDGGMTGKGDGKCPDFNANKKDPKQIWPETSNE